MSKIGDASDFPEVRKTSTFVFWNQTRIYIMVLTLICLTFIQMNTATFNFTVICMQDVSEEFRRINNSTELHWFERPTEKSLLFSGAAIGGLIGLVPAVPLITSLGLRNVQTISGFFSGIGAFCFPIAMSLGFPAALLCRIFQGIGSAVMFTTVGVVPGVWAKNSEGNRFMAILSCALQLSNVICMPVSGILCESQLGWRSIYYLFGSLTFIIYAVFWFTYSDDPKMHRNVSQKELQEISIGKVQKIKEPVPYTSVCKDPTVVSTWICCFGGNLGFFVLSLYGPTYLREILEFDVKETGFLTALPFILSAFVKFGAGQLSDKLSFLSEKARFVFFAWTSQIGLAVGFLIMALTSSRLVAQIAYNFAIVTAGLNIMGVIKCIQLRCRQHVHFAIAVISFTAYVVQFLAPILVSFMCPGNTREEWTLLFFVITAFIVICNASFPFVTKSEAADYTQRKIEKVTEGV